MSKKRVIVLDTETTGLDAKSGDEVIEIGLVEIIDGEIGVTHNWRYKPNKPINIQAQNVHSLNYFDLIDCPKFNSPELKKLGEFLNGDELIIHNAAFDIGMLDVSYERYNLKFSDYHGQVIDTLKIARSVFKGTNKKCNLDALCDYYMIDKTSRVYHGALIDCFLLAQVFNKLLPDYFKEGNYLESSNNSENISFDTNFKRFSL